MKHQVLLALLAISTVLSAQSEPQQESLLKLNMSDFVQGRYELLYEKVLDNETTFVLAFNGIGWVESTDAMNYFYDSDSGIEYLLQSEAILEHSGWGITPEIRRYAWNNGGVPEGVFLSAFARFESHSVHVEEELMLEDGWPVGAYDTPVVLDFKRTHVGAGLLVGFQWVADNGLSLEIFAGPEFRSLGLNWSFPSELGDAEETLAQQAFEDRILSDASFRTENLIEQRTGPYLRFGITAGLGL